MNKKMKITWQNEKGLTRHNVRRGGGEGHNPVRDYSSVEKRNNTTPSPMPSGMRSADFYRAAIPTGMKQDYQGNNRMVLNSSGGVEQAINYYAFGASFAENPARTDQFVQKYKYNGKELDRMFGLDYYDYLARIYDPIGDRFWTMDPLAELRPNESPYSAFGNNPVRNVDPTGLYWVEKKDEEYAKKLQKEMGNRVESEQKSLDKLNAKIAQNQEKGKDVSKDQTKADEMKANIDNLNTGISELTDMGATTEKGFTYNMTSEDVGGAKIENGVVVMNIAGNGNVANGIHESSHGFDIWKSGMPSTVPAFYTTETKAYGRQFSFGGSSVMPSSDWGSVRSLSDITTPWVTGITHNGDYMYGQQIMGTKYNRALLRALINEYRKK